MTNKRKNQIKFLDEEIKIYSEGIIPKTERHTEMIVNELTEIKEVLEQLEFERLAKPKYNDTFRAQLEYLINRYSMENGSNTPDYILARYLIGCLNAFNQATKDRDSWYHQGKVHCPGIDPTKGEKALD